MTEDYRQAALRHYLDANFLADGERYDNAGHLIGFAAECAIKSVFFTGQPIPKGKTGHLPELAQIALKRIQSRDSRQSRMHRVLHTRSSGFFDDWQVSSRYCADGHVSAETYGKWKRLAEDVLDAAGIRQ